MAGCLFSETIGLHRCEVVEVLGEVERMLYELRSDHCEVGRWHRAYLPLEARCRELVRQVPAGDGVAVMYKQGRIGE